jgi:hypothetical protein
MSVLALSQALTLGENGAAVLIPITERRTAAMLMELTAEDRRNMSINDVQELPVFRMGLPTKRSLYSFDIGAAPVL